MDRTRHKLKLDIKGVTFYNFKIEKIDGRWYGEVVFDL
jgi:SHS2 domain-containing protein